MPRPLTIATLGVAAVIGATSAARSDDGWKISLGAGVGFAPEYEGADTMAVLPLASAKVARGHRYLALRGTELTLNVLDSAAWQVGPLLRYRFGRDGADDPLVDRLRDVDPSLELGAFVAYNLLNRADPRFGLTLRFDIAHDTIDGHGGLSARAGVTYRKPFGQQWIGTLGGSLGYGDDTYMNAYFGVDAGNSARSGLPVYEAGGTLKDASLRASLTYYVTRAWTVTGLFGYSRLLADAAASPIVDRGSTSQIFSGLMLGYQF